MRHNFPVETALRPDRLQTDDYLEGLMEGFVAYDAAWVMTYMNAAAERILGRRRDEVLGKTWHQAFPHAVGNEVDLMYQRVMRSRIAERMEYCYAHYGLWMEISASPVRSGGVAVYFRDITDRVRAIDALRASEARARLQVSALTRVHELALTLGGLRELAQMLQVTLQTAAGFHGASRGLLSLYDRSNGVLEVAASIGMDAETLEQVRRVTPGPDAGACGSAFALRRRVVVRDTDSDACFVLYREVARHAGFRAVHSTPIINRSGEILGILSVHFDEPREPTQLEMQLADICARHAADAIELGRFIEDLRHAGEELRAADRRKDEFLATLAHELRNPLAPICNGLAVLRNTLPGSDDALQARTMMERQARHLVRLVDDLMEVSRINAGRLELRREAVELSSAVATAVESSRPLIDSFRHELRVELPPQPVVLNADPVRLSQVLSNLLNNAAKYTPPGGVVQLTASVDAGEVCISVQDNGVGLAAEALPRVFDRYARVGQPALGGLGLGLSLARSLVEMHGGRIEAASEGLGYGSTFTVRLPPHPQATPVPQRSSEPQAA